MSEKTTLKGMSCSWFFKINDEKIINKVKKLLFEALQIGIILFFGREILLKFFKIPDFFISKYTKIIQRTLNSKEPFFCFLVFIS